MWDCWPWKKKRGLKRQKNSQVLNVMSFSYSMTLPLKMVANESFGPVRKIYMIREANFVREGGGLERFVGSRLPALLFGIDVPDDVVGETDDLVTGSLGHLGKTLGLGLVLESVAGEVDT